MSNQKEMFRHMAFLERKRYQIERLKEELAESEENTAKIREQIRENNIQLEAIKERFDTIWNNIKD